ncbi:MAG: InlB B-repeat-containing protein, partial [Clostridia bacterium]|nr:InlB B-repeat-containing protein [Clostridia bacterium]
MNVIKKLLFTIGIILSFTNILLGTETFAAHYKNDITPPWGRVYVEKSAKVDGTTYVGETPVSVKIYAKDDICKDEEIKYYISTEPISNTTKLKNWYDYEEGKSHEINLNDDGAGKVYTVFKDANGNTSLTYEANVNTMQNIVFDANGGEAVPTEVDTKRIYGMPYVLPVQEPYKRGEYFLGWSTDKNASVGSYRQGEAIPADASLGTEESVILYAIYGTDVSKFPDLVDVVEIGDYVNYPVYYDNVVTWVETNGVEHPEYTSKLNGWRVLKKDEETGEVTLISAGVPLSLYKDNNGDTCLEIASKMASTTEFLNIGFTTEQTDGKFRKNGFTIYDSLVEAFTNKYTIINGGIPEVRAMTLEDVNYIYKLFGETTDEINNENTDVVINDKKFKEMLAIPSNTSSSQYWVATTTYNDNRLWSVGGPEQRTGYTINFEFGVRPVVTLKSNIKATGKDIDGAWNIDVNEKVVRKPSVNKVTYTGYEENISLNYDSRYIEITGETKATEPGIYTAVANLKDNTNYTWADGTTEPKEIEWEIKREIYVTLYIDGMLGFSNNTGTIEGKTVSKSYGNIANSHYASAAERPWDADGESITTVNFVNEIFPTYSTAYWFSNCKNLKTINNINNINTSSVVAMNHMFDYCEALSY